MLPLVALVSLLFPLTLALPCVQFDATFNLYAFGGTQDVKLGMSSTWGSPSPTPLSTVGRPPWTGNDSQCLLSQFNNAMYVLGGDSSDLSTIYIYDFAGDKWSTQNTSTAPSNFGNSRSGAVLDHDTNVIFSIDAGSGATMYQLDLSAIKATSGASQAWSTVENPSFSTHGYSPVAAQASNHIHYFGVPGTAAGSANLFVVHYAYFQPAAQSYPTLNSGAAFPDSAGQAFSIPDSQNNAPNQMVFVPNDFSNSYVVTHWTNPGAYNSTNGAPFATNLINTTQLLPAPSSKDTAAAYAADPSNLVQIDSAGNIYYMTGAIGSDHTVSTSASWTKMNFQLSGTGGTASNATTSASASSASSGSAASSSGGGSAGGAAVSQTSGTAASSASGSGTSAAAKTSGGARVKASLGRWDLMGLVMGLVAVGGATVL